jgi:hypothetical protein
MEEHKILEGQIKVAVRVRPLIAREKQEGLIYWKVKDDSICQVDPQTNNASVPYTFGKSQVFTNYKADHELTVLR